MRQGEPGPEGVEVLLSQPGATVEVLREVARRADALEHSANHEHFGAQAPVEAAVMKLEAEPAGGASTEPDPW